MDTTIFNYLTLHSVKVTYYDYRLKFGFLEVIWKHFICKCRYITLFCNQSRGEQEQDTPVDSLSCGQLLLLGDSL